MNNTLVFWRSNPMDVNLGVFEYLLNNWEGKIIVVSQKGYSDERKKCGWSTEQNLGYDFFVLSDMENQYEFEETLIKENKDAIHIFAGLRGEMANRINKLKAIEKNPKIVIIAERPATYSAGIKGRISSSLRYMLYLGIALKYRKNIRAFLAMGEKGVAQYIAYGFNRKTMFQYMYCPVQPKIERIKSYNSDRVRFLYIGRFDRRNKGIDVLMEAVDSITNSSNWTLDLVGGYGEYAEQTIAWCEKRDNTNYLGKWNFDEVCQKMADYDVCIVPSKYDGWNLSPNQAIHSGIATIVSDQASSDELIKYSGAGIVFKLRDAMSLKDAMERIINNRKELEEFKYRTHSYADLISPDTVGKYFIEILQYVVSNKNKKPNCPWRVYKK